MISLCMGATSLATVPAAAIADNTAPPIPTGVIQTVAAAPSWAKIKPYLAKLPQASQDRLTQSYDEAAQSAVFQLEAATRPDYADAAFFADMRERVVLKGQAALAKAKADLATDERAVADAATDAKNATLALRKAEAAAPRERLCATIAKPHGRHITSCHVAPVATAEVAAARDALTQAQQTQAAAQKQAAADRAETTGIAAEPAEVAALSRPFAAGKSVAQSFYLSLAMRTQPDEAAAQEKLAARSDADYSFDLADARASAVLDATSELFAKKWSDFYATYRQEDQRIEVATPGDMRYFTVGTQAVLDLTVLARAEADILGKTGRQCVVAVNNNRLASGEFGDKPWLDQGQFEAYSKYGSLANMYKIFPPKPEYVAETMEVMRQEIPNWTCGNGTFYQNPDTDRKRGTDYSRKHPGMEVGTVGNTKSIFYHAIYKGIGHVVHVPNYQIIVSGPDPVEYAQAHFPARVQMAAARPARVRARFGHVGRHRYASAQPTRRHAAWSRGHHYAMS